MISDDDLAAIEQRLTRALDVAPQPWTTWLETQGATGGCSFVALDGDSPDDLELYVDVFAGNEQWISPDARLDALVDFVGNSAEDVRRLLDEVRRLRGM
ncbi:hypothetical protein [Lentzea sp. NBRC 102530]|uniref:hypothetical protein n=1 Tax=Lentzea sp. NBRC 102530 TaxID=3032201 RepID=UPI0024A3679F|nr:hypothetical protein [Lentzea sp. NBRC 102530]GLY50907.1 hypothetical protein Lesp01_45630 [Lentzea sp. NBRC 102530]